MTEWVTINWRHWSKPMRLSASLIGGAVTLAVVYTLLAGTPKPVLPSSALFEPVSIEQTLSSSRPELSSFDFIFRPIFALNRKPPAHPNVPSEDEASSLAAEETEALPLGSLDGVKLLGVFGSGGVEGAIVRLDTGERRRLVTGEKLDGWQLQSIFGRSVRFAADSGQAADLTMILSRSQQPFVEQVESAQTPRSIRSGPTEETSDGDSTPQPAEATSQAGTFSFESMYRDRYRDEVDE